MLSRLDAGLAAGTARSLSVQNAACPACRCCWLGVRVTRGAGGNLGGSGSDEEEMLVDVGSEEEEEEEAAQEQQQQGSRRGTRRRRRLAPDDCTVM